MLHLHPLANSGIKWLLGYKMVTLTTHGQLEDRAVKERTDQLPPYAEAKKTKPLTLHTNGYLSGLAQNNAVVFLSPINVSLH